jgi:outer membrane receptor protein involved in Fe transport
MANRFIAHLRAVAYRCALALTVAATSVATGVAAVPSTVSGMVVASDGTPVAGARITLTTSGTELHAVSDRAGHFEIDTSTGGTYLLVAAAPGFQTLSERIITIAQQGTTLTLTLSRATTATLTTIGEVSTSAGQSVPTTSVPSISLKAQDAAASGVTAVSSMMWNQMSVTPIIPLGGGSNATASFAIRGPDPTETLVDIDGHQMNNGNTGDFDLSLVDPASLQDVQLVYGISPSSLVGPNTIGGAINILTLEPTVTPQSLIRVFAGSYNSFGETLQSTGTDGRFGYAFSLHGASSDGSVNQTVDAPGPNPVGSNARDQSLIDKLRYQLGGTDGYGYVQLDFRSQDASKDLSSILTTYTPQDEGGGPGGSYQAVPDTGLAAHQDNYGVDLQLPLGNQRIDGMPATMLQFSHLTSLNQQTVNGPGLDSLQYLYDQRDLLGDDWVEVDHRLSGGVLSFKYDIETETLDSDYVEGQVLAQWFNRQARTMQAAASSAPTPQYLTSAQTERSAVLRYNGDPTAHIHYSLAAYYSAYSTFGTSFNPRAGFVWTPTAKTALRASVGSTFQIPMLWELISAPVSSLVPIGGVVYAGNPNLKPDFATEYDLGADHFFGRLHLSGDVYRTNLRATSNQLVVTPIPNCETPANPTACPVSTPINAGDGVYQGIDLRAEEPFANGYRIRAGWDEDSSYLSTVSNSIQDGTLVIGEQSLGQPLHKAYFGIGRDVAEGWSFGTSLNYDGTYNELNRAPYATLDAHVAYARGGYTFGLYGTNLTNVYAQPFNIVNGGILYGAEPGNPMIPTPAYVLQGTKIVFVVTRTL